MKHLFKILIAGLISFSFVSEEVYRSIPNDSFRRGEKLRYRVHYGFLTAGGATMEVNPKLYRVNDRICYRVDTKGYTSGTFSLMMKVDDLWRTYIDTAALVSQKFYRKIRENKYRKIEHVYYDHEKDLVRVVDDKRNIDKNYSVPDQAQDMISGYYYLRNYDFNKMRENDTLTIPGFVEDQSYKLDLVYKGKGRVKNRLGKFNCLKLVPVMPENSFFDGENSLRIWVTDDESRIPVKIEADMFIGAIEIDLEEYSGLKHRLNKVD